MATVINNPGGTSESSGGMGFMVGVILLVGVVFLLLYFGLPALRSASTGNTGSTTPQINIPDKVDVNVNNPGNPPAQ